MKGKRTSAGSVHTDPHKDSCMSGNQGQEYHCCLLTRSCIQTLTPAGMRLDTCVLGGCFLSQFAPKIKEKIDKQPSRRLRDYCEKRVAELSIIVIRTPHVVTFYTKYNFHLNLIGLIVFFSQYFWGGFFIVFSYLYSALLHLPPLRFHCADGCWDRTQDRCKWCIDSQML
jgi:hypothetical protein